MLRYSRHPDAVWREEAEAKGRAESGLESGDDVAELATSTVLLGGTVVTLNLLGTEIWKRCDGSSLEEIADAIAELFDAERDVLHEDLSAFLDDLLQRGFLNAS